MDFDYRQPDYTAVFKARSERLERLRADKALLADCKLHYRHHPWDFVSDWGMTYEPRNLERGLLANIPFVLWDKQIEFLKWLHGMWRQGERGLAEKSRDCGVTWLCVGYAVSQWLHEPGFATGFGSRKEDLVDRAGDPDSIFEKVRHFVRNVPTEFLPPGLNPKEHFAHMKLLNPDNGASITGEAGDNIGRGGRKSVYLVDEAAFIERQQLVDAALSQTTNCQIDISTPNGNGNPFYKKRMRLDKSPNLFIFDWRDDPRKDDAWYQKQVEDLDEVTVAQEIDRDYNASAEDSFIPAKWVKAAIDAHIKLGFAPSGIRVTGFDPADVGDAKAIVNRHGSIIMDARQMTRGDITQALPWAFMCADEFRADALGYDADGMGAPTMKVSLKKALVNRVKVVPYHGSAGVENPNGRYGEDRQAQARRLKPKLQRDKELHDNDRLKTNADTFTNYRAQTWTWARDRFKATYDAVERANAGQVVHADPDELISISSQCEEAQQLVAELSRPMRIFGPTGKIQVESKAAMKKRGVDSPNLADAAVIAFSVRQVEPPKQTTNQTSGHRPADPGMGY